jgi:hypothetical protein
MINVVQIVILKMITNQHIYIMLMNLVSALILLGLVETTKFVWDYEHICQITWICYRNT